MKYTIKRKVDLTDASMDSLLRADALMLFLQDAAVEHSSSLGFNQEKLEEINRHWVLSKIAINVDRLPELNEELHVETWSAGSDKIKGFRNYIVRSEGEVVCRASSVWIFMDTQRRRPVRFDKEIVDCFGTITEKALELNLDEWKPEKLGDHIMTTDVSVRYTDFDLNGHVNNTHYIDYLQSALFTLGQDFKGIKSLKMRFGAEITPDVQKVYVTLSKNKFGYVYHIYDGRKVFVSGEVLLL